MHSLEVSLWAPNYVWTWRKDHWLLELTCNSSPKQFGIEDFSPNRQCLGLPPPMLSGEACARTTSAQYGEPYF